MKKLILTGLATEQSFEEEGNQFYLVFNKGELRIPVSEETAETVLRALYEKNGATRAPAIEVEEDYSRYESPAPSPPPQQPQISNYEVNDETDEDGVYQV